VLSGPNLLVIAQAESPQPVRLSIEAGSKVAPLATVSGHLLIAQVDAQKRWGFLQTDEMYIAMDANQRDRLQTTLKKIARDG
jgi:DNA-binding IclR family transcriptional regulator